MASITVRVTDGPRWCAELNRWQHNGEEITITADSDAELLSKWAFYEVHCRELVAGVIPVPAGQPAPKIRQFDQNRERVLKVLAEKRQEEDAAAIKSERVYFKATPGEAPPQKPKRTSKSEVRVARS